jgi:hypothetical protein
MSINKSSYFCAAALFVGAAVWLSAQPTVPPGAIRGFSAAGSAAEAARERELKAMPSAEANEADFDVMTAEPHHTGSPYQIKIDPQFAFSVLATQTTGVALLRLADAEVLPFDYESYGAQILEYIGEIEQQATKASADGAQKVDFTGLRVAAEAFKKAGADVRARGESMLAASASAQDLAAINHRLIMAERDLIEPAGLPDRPWYRHVVYAPGLYTGYGVKTIPGVREAVDAGNYTRAAEQATVVIRALKRATSTLWP